MRVPTPSVTAFSRITNCAARNTDGLIALLCGLVVIWGLVLHPGIPAYHHDWQWPPYPEMLRSFAASKLDAWSWSNLGSPNLSLQVHPYYAVIGLASFVMSSKSVLALVIGMTTFVGAYGAARLSRRYSYDQSVYPAVAAVLFGLSPFAINELVAGHIEVLVAAAALPWVLYFAHRDARPNSAGLAFSLCWTTLHLQYFFFAIVLILVFAGLRSLLRNYISCFAVTAVLLPQGWALLRPAAHVAASGMETSLPWLAVQSQPVMSALSGAHYFAHYWGTAVSSIPLGELTQWFYPAGVLGLIFLRKAPYRALAIAFVAAVIALSALDGPFSLIFRSLINFPTSGLFREPYHAAAVVELLGAVAASIAIGSFPRAARTTLAFVCCAFVVAPFLTQHIFSQTSSVYPDREIHQMLLREARSAVPARMFLPPGFSPVGPLDVETGGADPLAFAVGNMIPLWSYRPTNELAGIVWQLNRHSNDSALLSQLGIESILYRTNLQSKLAPAVAYTGAPSIPFFGAEHISSTGQRLSSTSQDASMYRVQGSVSILWLQRVRPIESAPELQSPFFLVEGDNPGMNWAPANDWWFLNSTLAQNAAGGAITWSQNATLYCRRTTENGLRVDFSLFEKASNREVRKSITAPLNCLRGTQVPFRLGSGTYAVAMPLGRKEHLRSQQPLSQMPLGHYLFTGPRIAVTSLERCSRCYIVLSAKFDDGWTVRVDGVSLKPAKSCCQGLGMRWVADLRAGSKIDVLYAPQRVATLLEFIASLSWTLLILCGVLELKNFYQRRSVSA